jgi:hypothetical protein
MKGKVENISGIEKLEDIVQFAKETSIDLVCIGPEQPLVDGLCDLMKAQVVILTLSDLIFVEHPLCWTCSKCSSLGIFQSLVERFYAKKLYSNGPIC